jgi:enamine deaminase RidA (YjgF/YER057c/UK114 family)
MTGGSSIARVLQVTIYLTDLAEKPDFNRVWKTHFNEVNLPARAVIGVADLGTGVKLELVATAAVDG